MIFPNFFIREVFIFLFCYQVFFWGNFVVKGEHPDVRLSTVEIIKKYGYPVETHEIVTEDGYMLTMYRIPHGKNGSNVNKKPILLMHGLYGQCENYIISGMNNASLAFGLADKNYDVWLGNTRGSQHGRKHKFKNPNKRGFWNFSYHEIGFYDLPAKIDYILKISKKKKMYYIGHSQGGTSFYIMCSERPEYQKKIVAAALLAPAGYMKHFANPLILPIVPLHKELVRLSETSELYELPPRQMPMSMFLNQICQSGLLRNICISIYHILVNGGDSGEFDMRMLPLVIKFLPSVSPRQPLHYAQSISSGRFRKFDYGPAKNQQKYGQLEPPDYNLKNITVPIAIYYGKGDMLVYQKDIEHICNVLPKCIGRFLMENPKWSHLDFIFAINGMDLLYNPLMKVLEKYEKL